jgi:catechol 2,3-dioxygenase-like lactoylglutathione lyase family enzyme
VGAASVWTARDFPDEGDWSFTLSDDDRKVLIAYARGESPEARLAEHFGAAVQRWSRLLTEGPGFVRLRGFPIAALTQAEIARAYLGLGGLLGRPVGQDRDANVITHIRDERLPANPGVRKYRTNQRQDFHSDGSDLVGLLCLHPAASGGESKIASAHAVYNEMLRRATHLVDVMYQPMPWDRNDEQGSGEAPFFELPPIIDIDGLPRLFFIAWYIRDSQRHPRAPRLTDDQCAALDLAESIANDPAFHIEMRFEPGDIQLLNNTTVLHSREAYTDAEDADHARLRHLLRLWLKTEHATTHQLLRDGIPRQNPSHPVLRRIHHTAIICADYERSKAFYTQVLGLREVAENYRAARRSWKLDLALPDGGQIELFSFPDPPPRPSRPEAQGLRHLAFAVDDIAAWSDHLASRGVAVEPVRVDEFTGRRFTFFADPDGLPLELYETKPDS